jgi:hypothetical protein
MEETKMKKNKNESDVMNTIIAAAILAGAKTKDKDNNGIKELAKLLYDSYIAFMEVGFTSEQAFQLTLALKD